jgi:hypothetical protein
MFVVSSHLLFCLVSSLKMFLSCSSCISLIQIKPCTSLQLRLYKFLMGATTLCGSWPLP